MKLIVNKDRSVIPIGTWGTVNENDYEILDFEFPEELDGYNKRIVYYLGDEKVWDAIVDNKAYITNAITTKGDVKAYVWCTKENTEREADTDFRTMLFDMHFYENDNADGIVPTPEQVDGFNTMLTAMNAKIEEINELETTIKNAETQRQEHEETRQENESTRQTNEQTRQSQEAERERRTDEAIADIEDKTAEYNANAEAKTTAFNQNATQKTNDFNLNYTQKVNDFNTNATTQKTDFNTNASSKTSAFNSNAETKTNAFNTNATSKTNAFNSNASEKTTAFDNNASTKTSEFNTNAESKTTNFNTNATSKTNDFNDNATEKTDEFNTNAQEKIDEYDEHIVEYQAQIDELQEEVEELSENMPWNTTEQATEISVDDAAKYSKNKLELFGNTSQFSTTGKNKLPYPYAETTVTRKGITFTDNGDGSITINGTAQGNSSFLLFGSPYPEMQENFPGNYISGKNCSNSILCRAMYADKQESGAVFYRTVGQSTGTSVQMNTTQYPKGYVEITVLNGTTVDNVTIYPMITDTQDNDYEPYVGGVPSPNPDYPQPIHVVTGNNTIEVQGKNLFPSNLVRTDKDWLKVNNDGSISIKYDSGNNINFTSLFSENLTNIPTGNYKLKIFVKGTFKGGNLIIFNTTHHGITQSGITNNNVFTIINSDIGNMQLYVVSAGTDCTIKFELEEGTNVPTEYHKYYHADYPINLGSLELCKIGNYQDYIYKENGNWYIQKNTKKTILDKPTTGNLNTDYTYNYFSYRGEPSGIYPGTDIICSHFIGAYNTADMRTQARYNNSVYWGSNATFVRVDKFNTVEEYINALSANDITIIGRARTPTTTQITDETLIAQLDEIYEHLKLAKGTNNITVTASDLAPYMELSYMQDLPSKLDNLDSRLSLLE